MKIKRLFFTALSIILSLCVIEISLRVVYSFLKSDNSKVKVQQKSLHLADAFFTDPSDEFSKANYKAHPYFGYKLDSEWDLDVPDKNTFTFAFFGGSVAKYVAQEINKNRTYYGNFIKDIFPCLKEKNFDFLNLAWESSKQPQQFVTATFFQSKFDLSINIEGHNEFYNDQYPTHPPYYPWFSDYLYPNDQNLNSNGSWIVVLSESYNYLSKITNHNYSYTLRFASKLIQRIIKKQMFKIESETIKIFKRHKESANLSANASTHDSEKINRIKILAKYWLHFSRLQNKILTSLGKTNFYVLQPIPDLTPKSKFSTKNMEFGNFYKLILDINKNNPNPNFIDLSTVFTDYPKEAFRDSCCHMNDTSRKYFIQRILKEIQGRTNGDICSNMIHTR